MLTFHFQKELAIDINPTVPAIRHAVTNTHTIVSALQNDVENTHIVTRREALKICVVKIIG